MYSRSHRLAAPSASFQASFAGCRQNLAAARALADAGLGDAALELCLDLVLDELAVLEADPSLLPPLLEILLLTARTGGTGLASRLLRAMFGATVVFLPAPLPAPLPAKTSQAFTVSRYGERVTVVLDPAALEDGLGAERAASWSRQIIATASGADQAAAVTRSRVA